MDLIVLDKTLTPVYLVEAYQSVIWTDRYDSAGDFELTLNIGMNTAGYFIRGNYLMCSESRHLMIIEDIVIRSDFENGTLFTISGRSLESILERRIIWKQQILKGSLQNQIKTNIFNKNIISPSDASRRIDEIVFQNSTDSSITSLTIECQFTGDTVYDAVQSICQKCNFGFQMLFDLATKKFIFSLYNGKDHSGDDPLFEQVIFSPGFENLINSNYEESDVDYRTVALVAGEDEGARRKYIEYDLTGATGINRKELFVDARDVQSEYTDDEGVEHTLTPTEYNNQLIERGQEKLAEQVIYQYFEGEAEMTKLFTLGEDFDLGDIVLIKNEYGFSGKARITEVVYSQDENGYKTYPTFAMIE